MAVKFQCPKCEKRFVDWGAEKLGFKCPDCKESTLIRIGFQDDQMSPTPTLKRRKAKVVVRPVVDHSVDVSEVEDVEDDSEEEVLDVEIAGDVGDEVSVDEEDGAGVVLADDDDAEAEL
jgi:predicted RNA-binding Zn-ribbon protein involved in translation (DUF1610 family)